MKIGKPVSFGQLNKPKAVVFGAEGSGKSTMGSKLSKALFIDVEGGISGIDIDL